MAKKKITTAATCQERPEDFERMPWWAIDYPVANGYGNGCESGKFGAHAILKHFRSDAYLNDGGKLQQVVLNFAEQLQAAQTEEERTTVRGKIVGMFSALESWLVCGARCGSTDWIRSTTVESIKAELQDAADGGPDQRWDAEIKADQSKSARHAANARWSKAKADAALKKMSAPA
jgi:hypothetical protein